MQQFEKTKPTNQFVIDDTEYLQVTYYDLLALVEGVTELAKADFVLSTKQSEYAPFIIYGSQFVLTFERETAASKLAKAEKTRVVVDANSIPSLTGVKVENKEEEKPQVESVPVRRGRSPAST